jgi:hypothetical protein
MNINTLKAAHHAHGLLTDFLIFSDKVAIIPLNTINRLVFVIELHYVFCTV